MYDVTLANKRFMQERWFAQYFGTVQGNEELGLDIREVLGAGHRPLPCPGHAQRVVRRRGPRLRPRELRERAEQNSLEGVLATAVFVLPCTTRRSARSISGLAVFPSLTESGRVRAEADIDSRFEIVKDLFFDVSVYGSYDSKADPAAPSNSDYGWSPRSAIRSDEQGTFSIRRP